MPTFAKYLSALKKLFERKPVVLLEELCSTLGTASRTTIFRILSRVGYRTSFNYAGRYYTLKDIPQFDTQGIWYYQHIGYSAYGTLRQTLVHFIEHSPAGQTHQELQARLGLRVHDTLLSLVESQSIDRQRYQDAYLYLSKVPEEATAQLAKRQENALRVAAPDFLPWMNPATTIDVLVYVLHHPQEDARTIAARLTTVSAQQVEALLGSYGLQKKTARSRWKPWPP